MQSSLLSPRSGISQPKMPWGRGGGWGSNLLPRAPVQASVATRQAWDGSPQLGVTQALPRGLQSFPTVPRPHVYEAAEGSIKHKDPGRGQGTGAGGGGGAEAVSPAHPWSEQKQQTQKRQEHWACLCVWERERPVMMPGALGICWRARVQG